MTNARLTAVGRLAITALAFAAVACATTGRTPTSRDRFVAILDSLDRENGRRDGPSVTISTDHDVGRYSRVSTRLHVDDDAYVTVINVSPAGYASIVFPESPADDGFLQGGKAYVIPSYFTGYHMGVVQPVGALGTRYVWYGRSAYARLGARGPGYMFAVASRSPLNLDTLEAEGYFDDVRVGSSIDEMEPTAVIPHVAMLATNALRDGRVGVDYARYSGYDPSAYTSTAFQSSYNTYCQDAFGMLWQQSNLWELMNTTRGCYSSNRRVLVRNGYRPPTTYPPRMPRDSAGDSARTDSSRTDPMVRGWRQVRRIPSGEPLLVAPRSGESVAVRRRRAREDADVLSGGERRGGARSERARAAHERARPTQERERPLDETPRDVQRGSDARRGRNRAAEASTRSEPRREEPRPAAPRQAEPRETRAPESRPAEPRPSESRAPESRPSEPRRVEPRPSEPRPSEPPRR